MAILVYESLVYVGDFRITTRFPTVYGGYETVAAKPAIRLQKETINIAQLEKILIWHLMMRKLVHWIPRQEGFKPHDFTFVNLKSIILF